MAVRTISGDLVFDGRNRFWACLEDAKGRKSMRQGVNWATPIALPAYVIVVAAIESFINENCLDQVSKLNAEQSVLWALDSDWVEGLPICQKLLIVPQLLYGKTFARDRQPYQDMRCLVQVRNKLTHYEMKSRIPSSVRDLVTRGVALRYEESMESGICWPDLLSCTEGVRWAHNTVCRTVHELTSFVPVEIAKNNLMKEICDRNFKEIAEAEVREWYEKEGIDLDG